jgi:hypothetical protein
MATQTGFSHTTIRRIWNAFGLQPHIVDLYLSPPNRALVLSVDERSQIQALDREQSVLPMMLGIPERRSEPFAQLRPPSSARHS